MNNIVLASGSPRRIELIGKLNVGDVAVVPPDIDETLPGGLLPEEAVLSLAMQKAGAVAGMLAPDTPLIVAADTMVYAGSHALGKPADAGQAVSMLKMLSGRSHSVYTGIALQQGDRIASGVEKTDVFFRELTEAEILGYVASGEPMDKAGAYAAQEGAAVFIERIEGDFWNIVGLPLCRLSLMLKDFRRPPISREDNVPQGTRPRK